MPKNSPTKIPLTAPAAAARVLVGRSPFDEADLRSDDVEMLDREAVVGQTTRGYGPTGVP